MAGQSTKTADYTFRKLTVGYTLRYLGKQAITDYETQHEVAGLEGTPYDPFYADRVNYPSVFYHDIRAALQVDERFTFYGGVDNITDRQPPLGLIGNNVINNTRTDTLYDNIGRYMFIGARVKI